MLSTTLTTVVVDGGKCFGEHCTAKMADNMTRIVITILFIKIMDYFSFWLDLAKKTTMLSGYGLWLPAFRQSIYL